MTSEQAALVRVDNRLVHGQILAAWIPYLKSTSLLVLDDEAAQNALMRSAMSIAVGPEVELLVRKVEMPASALPSERTLILVRDVADAVRARAGGLRLRHVNIGNVHFTTGRRAISPSVYLSEGELDALAALEKEGVQVEVRALPSDAPIGVEQMRKCWARAG